MCHIKTTVVVYLNLSSYSLPDYCSRLPGAFLLKCQPLLYFFLLEGNQLWFQLIFFMHNLKHYVRKSCWKWQNWKNLPQFLKVFLWSLKVFFWFFCILWSLIGDRNSFSEKVQIIITDQLFLLREGEEDPVSTVAIFLDINTFTSWHDRIITTCPIENFSLKDSQGECFVSSLRFIGKWQITGFCFPVCNRYFYSVYYSPAWCGLYRQLCVTSFIRFKTVYGNDVWLAFDILACFQH